jgi:hypothetical protein
MNFLILLLPLLLFSCSGYKMQNSSVAQYAIEVQPIRTEGGSLLQREIANQLIVSGFGYNNSQGRAVFCRVEVGDDSASAISKSASGKAARAKHNIQLELFFEDESGNEVLKPFKVSASQMIGFMEPDNESSMGFVMGDKLCETKSFCLGQFTLEDEAKEASRCALFEDLATKIVLQIQSSIATSEACS